MTVARRALFAATRLAPIVLAGLTLWLLEASRVEDTARFVPVAQPPPPTRLAIFWIDSLARRDVERDDLVPLIRSRAERSGLHGPVRACADAVSVPCFTAMTSAVDRFSIFSLGRNLGGMQGVPKGSLFHALQKRGIRIGYLGDPIFVRAVTGLDWTVIEEEIDDLAYIREGIAALDRENLQIVIIHLRETDGISHRLGPDHPEYKRKVRVLDRAIDEAIGMLRPTDHALVMGDHGHTEDGRHFAGLDVPTYAAFFGPEFRRRLYRPMAITDHAALWAHLFGLRLEGATWQEDYFAGRPVDVPPELPVVQGGKGVPIGYALLAVCLALIAGAPFGWGRLFRGRAAAVVLGAAAIVAVVAALGAFWTVLRPSLSFRPRHFNHAMGLATAAVGVVLGYPALRSLRARSVRWDERWIVPAVAATVLLALPTVYKYGSTYVALFAFLWLLGATVVDALRSRRFVLVAAVTLYGWLLMSLWDPAVRNFAVRWFTFYRDAGRWNLPLAAGFVVVAVALSRGRPPRRRAGWWGGAAFGLAACAGVKALPSWTFAVPCGLAVFVALAAWRWRELEPVALAVTLPAIAFFFEADPTHLGLCAATLLAWAAWPWARPRSSALERGLVTLVLTWLSFWTTLGARMTGLNFNFFFSWLPAGADVKDTWVLNTLATLAKYAAVPLLGSILARRAAVRPLEAALPVAWTFARMKLGLVLVFLALFSAYSVDAGPFITADVIQEVVVWMMMLGVLGALPITRAREKLRSRMLQTAPRANASRASS